MESGEGAGVKVRDICNYPLSDEDPRDVRDIPEAELSAINKRIESVAAQATDPEQQKLEGVIAVVSDLSAKFVHELEWIKMLGDAAVTEDLTGVCDKFEEDVAKCIWNLPTMDCDIALGVVCSVLSAREEHFPVGLGTGSFIRGIRYRVGRLRLEQTRRERGLGSL